jgi:hypothetical protein
VGQAAFYYVGACAPKSTTNMEAAASLMLQLGAKTKVYMINKAAYGSEAEAQSAAKTAVGQTGSKGALGLNVIAAGKADQATIDKMAQSLTSTVCLPVCVCVCVCASVGHDSVSYFYGPSLLFLACRFVFASICAVFLCFLHPPSPTTGNGCAFREPIFCIAFVPLGLL